MTDKIKTMLPILFFFLLLGAAFLCGWIVNEWKNTVRIEAIRTEAAEKAAKAEKSAREAEQTHAQAIAQIDKNYTEKLQNERNRNAAVIADLRRGALQLQDRFTCASGVTDTVGATGVGDAKAGAGLQLADAEFLVSEAGRADRVVMQLQACQDIVMSDRSINKKDEANDERQQ